MNHPAARCPPLLQGYSKKKVMMMVVSPKGTSSTAALHMQACAVRRGVPRKFDRICLPQMNICGTNTNTKGQEPVLTPPCGGSLVSPGGSSCEGERKKKKRAERVMIAVLILAIMQVW